MALDFLAENDSSYFELHISLFCRFNLTTVHRIA
jgi:hypothetical protein